MLKRVFKRLCRTLTSVTLLEQLQALWERNQMLDNKYPLSGILEYIQAFLLQPRSSFPSEPDVRANSLPSYSAVRWFQNNPVRENKTFE